MSNGWDLVDRIRELSRANMGESGEGLGDTGRTLRTTEVEFCADTKCDCEKYGGLGNTGSSRVELGEGLGDTLRTDIKTLQGYFVDAVSTEVD